MTPAGFADFPRGRGATSERDFQAMVVEIAQLLGWTTYHTFDSRRSDAGFPDLVLVRGDRLVFAELKSATGRVSAAQAAWLDQLRVVPGVEVFLWRPADWPTIEATLSRTRQSSAPRSSGTTSSPKRATSSSSPPSAST